MSSKKTQKPEQEQNKISAPMEDGAEKQQAADETFEEKYEKLNGRFLRLAADFDNYKKRSEKEKQQQQRSGMLAMAESVFEILDSLELALRHGSGSDADSGGLVQGIRLTYEQSVSQLKNFGINQISAAVGEKFNPALHHAIEKRHSEKVGKDCVLQEIKKGYTREDALIRPVAVVVSSGKEETNSGKTENG